MAIAAPKYAISREISTYHFNLPPSPNLRNRKSLGKTRFAGRKAGEGENWFE